MYTDKHVVSHLDKHQLAGTLYNIKCVAALLIRPHKVTQIYIYNYTRCKFEWKSTGLDLHVLNVCATIFTAQRMMFCSREKVWTAFNFGHHKIITILTLTSSKDMCFVG